MGWTIIDTEKVAAIGLFASLSQNALEEIAAIMYTQEYDRGDKVFDDGAPGESMYFIMKGEIRISKNIPGLGEEALAILKPGAYFGEMGLLEGAPTSAEAWANKGCILAVIDRVDLLELMGSEPELSIELLWSFVRTLSARLRESNSKVTFLAAAGSF